MRKLAVGIALLGTGLLSTATFAQADGEFHARSVHRGAEEPGKYSPANLFDGDPSTEFCSAPEHLGELVVYLSDADKLALRGVKAIHIAAKAASALAITLNLSHGGEEKLVGTVMRGVAEIPYRFVDGARRAGAESELHLHAEWFDKNAHPVCLSELTFLGANGPIALPSIAAAVALAHARQARLAKTRANPSAFARTYLTLFRWMMAIPSKSAPDGASESFAFADNGTYSRETDGTSDAATQGTWSVSNDGQSLSLTEGKSRATYALGHCDLASGNLCLSSGSSKMVTEADW